MDRLHVREEYTTALNEKKLRPKSVFKTSTGHPDCFKKERRKSGLENYGVGTVVYFQMLKYLGLLFTMCFFLLIPTMIFFGEGTEVEEKTFFKLLMATSLGNLGSAKPVCQANNFDLTEPEKDGDKKKGDRQDISATINLSCPFGELTSLQEFGQLSINDVVDCEKSEDRVRGKPTYQYFPSACYTLKDPSESDTYTIPSGDSFAKVKEAFARDCKDNNYCEFRITQDMIPDEFCSATGATIAQWQYVAVASCSSSTIKFGSSEALVTKNVIGIMAVLFYLLITFIFYCALLALKKIQTLQEEEVDFATVTASDFSVLVTQRAHLEDVEDLCGSYYAWAENICAMEKEQDCKNAEGELDLNQNTVFDVELGLTNLKYFDYMKRLGVLLYKKKKYKKTIAKIKKDGLGTIASCRKQNEDYYKQKIKEAQKEAKSVLKAANDYKKKEPAVCRYAFIQFQSMNGQKKFLEAMEISVWKKIKLMCCRVEKKNTHKLIGGKWPEVKYADEPSLINWANLGKTRIQQMGRKAASWTTAILLLLLGFVILIWLNGIKDQYNSNSELCGQRRVTLEEAYEESQATASFEGENVVCFCL